MNRIKSLVMTLISAMVKLLYYHYYLLVMILFSAMNLTHDGNDSIELPYRAIRWNGSNEDCNRVPSLLSFKHFLHI